MFKELFTCLRKAVKCQTEVYVVLVSGEMFKHVCETGPSEDKDMKAVIQGEGSRSTSIEYFQNILKVQFNKSKY